MASTAECSSTELQASRLRFFALHLYDLQTLRWLGVHLLLLLSPLFFFMNTRQNCCLLTLLAFCTACWFYSFTRTMRRRFGTTKLTTQQRMKLRYSSSLLGFVAGGFFLAHLICRYLLNIHHDDFIFFWWLSVWILPPMADTSNPTVRRVAYILAAASIVGSYGAISLLHWTKDWRGSLGLSSLGAVLLALALFDYNLLSKMAQGQSQETDWAR